MNINTLNIGENIESINKNDINEERDSIINNTKIETQSILKTPLEKLSSKINERWLDYIKTNNLELKNKILITFNALVEQNKELAIKVRNEFSDSTKSLKGMDKMRWYELTAWMYNITDKYNVLSA